MPAAAHSTRDATAASPTEETMDKPVTRAHRIVCLFLLAFLLFNYPMLALFNVSQTVLGVPVLYAYVFAAWALVIALAAAVIEGRG